MVESLIIEKSIKTRLANDARKWVQGTCIYCGRRYQYVENYIYRPKTCAEYKCVSRYLHQEVALR